MWNSNYLVRSTVALFLLFKSECTQNRRRRGGRGGGNEMQKCKQCKIRRSEYLAILAGGGVNVRRFDLCWFPVLSCRQTSVVIGNTVALLAADECVIVTNITTEPRGLHKKVTLFRYWLSHNVFLQGNLPKHVTRNILITIH